MQIKTKTPALVVLILDKLILILPGLILPADVSGSLRVDSAAERGVCVTFL